MASESFLDVRRRGPPPHPLSRFPHPAPSSPTPHTHHPSLSPPTPRTPSPVSPSSFTAPARPFIFSAAAATTTAPLPASQRPRGPVCHRLTWVQPGPPPLSRPASVRVRSVASAPAPSLYPPAPASAGEGAPLASEVRRRLRGQSPPHVAAARGGAREALLHGREPGRCNK